MINYLLSSEETNKMFNTIAQRIKDLSEKISLEYILYGCGALLLLTLIVTFVRLSATYEEKLLSKVKKLNAYLNKKQNIDENNLVEFNNKMKQVPKTVRHNWQEYMLYRDRPSKYLNCATCIDIPTRASTYMSTIRIFRIVTLIISLVAFILGLGTFYDITGGHGAWIIDYQVFMIPVLVNVVGLLITAILNAKRTANMSDLYYAFQQFEKNLDRACKTLPEVIDYEILFTKKEIKENIPALQEYLEKSEAFEKKRKEDEALISMVGENYDFEELGVDSSLLLERAMKESEKYLNVKRNFSERIRAKEQEKINYQKNFDEVTKDFERKAQASREIINSLSDQINQTTVKIEANYLKKKLNEEQARYQQYEKDYDLSSSRFQKEQQDIQYEIDKFNDEIKRRKTQATDNMLSEAKTYVNKIYGQVTETVLKQNGPILDENQAMINKLNEELANKNAAIQEKENIISEKEKQIEAVKQELNLRLAEIEATKTFKEYIVSEEFRERLVMSKKEFKATSKEDREAFKRVKREMKKPVAERSVEEYPSFAAEDAGVQVVKLEDSYDTGVQVVKLPEEPVVGDGVSDTPTEILADIRSAAAETRDELEELTDSIAEESRKLEQDTDELEQIKKTNTKKEESKPSNSLKDRMSKLNAKSQKAIEDDKVNSKSKKAPTFNIPKINK